MHASQGTFEVAKHRKLNKKKPAKKTRSPKSRLSKFAPATANKSTTVAASGAEKKSRHSSAGPACGEMSETLVSYDLKRANAIMFKLTGFTVRKWTERHIEIFQILNPEGKALVQITTRHVADSEDRKRICRFLLEQAPTIEQS